MKEKIFKIVFDPKLGLREQLFRNLILSGCVIGVLGIVECIVLMDYKLIQLPLIVMVIVMTVAAFGTFKYHNIEFSATLVGIMLNGMLFPCMFFMSGGIEGGASAWFIFSFVYEFIMFSGKKLNCFVGFSVLTDALVYVLAYLHPEWIIPMDARMDVFIDSFFAIYVVGFTAGIVVKIQIGQYERERERNEKQRQQLEDVGNYKNSFFANVSHEIRTPINSIIGLNELIKRAEPSEEIKEYTQSINTASKMLLGQVNDLLDMSQIEMNKMKIIPVQYRLKELLSELIDVISVLAREKGLEFRVDVDENLPSGLYGDEKRVRQVLLNILSNAVKYTNTGSVTFIVRGENKDDTSLTLRITVEDTGIGIRKEELEHLYEAFYRVDEQKHQKTEGSGLGLAISKQLVELMGGEITVDSIYTRGSTFTIQLEQRITDTQKVGDVRFWRVHENEKEKKYRQCFEAPEARILLVDDDPINRMVTAKLLAETKIQIDVAESGAQCLEMTRKKFYHVILLDYMMPDMDGAETFRELYRQENGLCKDSAVILMTAHAPGEAARIFAENRFHAYVEKPVQGEALEEEILRFLPEDIIEYRSVSAENPREENEIKRVWNQKRKRIYITSDCVCEIPREWQEKYDIRLMYLYIRTQKGRFMDTREIDSHNLMQYLSADESMIYADSASVEEYERFFADALTEADYVLHISMASKSGKSYGIAVEAAKGFDHVRVVDSGQISGGQGLIALYAGLMAREGYSVDEIIWQLEKRKAFVNNKFMLPSVKIFYERGYTGFFNAFICDVFGMHPILGMRQSKIRLQLALPGSLERAWKRYIHIALRRKRRINPKIVIITHVGLTAREQEFIKKEVLSCFPFENVFVERASVTDACNAGMKTVGIAYFEKVQPGKDILRDPRGKETKEQEGEIA